MKRCAALVLMPAAARISTLYFPPLGSTEPGPACVAFSSVALISPIRMMPKNLGAAGGGRDSFGGTKMEPPNGVPTLADLGLDKKTSSIAQKLAAESQRKSVAAKGQPRAPGGKFGEKDETVSATDSGSCGDAHKGALARAAAAGVDRGRGNDNPAEAGLSSFLIYENLIKEACKSKLVFL